MFICILPLQNRVNEIILLFKLFSSIVIRTLFLQHLPQIAPSHFPFTPNIFERDTAWRTNSKRVAKNCDPF